MRDGIPVLRHRRNSPKWSIYVPGTADMKGLWLATRTADELEAKRLLQVVLLSGIADAASAMRRDAMTRGYWRRLMIGRGITVRRSIDDYMAVLIMRGRAEATVETAGTTLDQWVREARCGTSPISSISTDQIAPWINPDCADLAYSTRVFRLNILNGFFSWCDEAERLPQNPCTNLYVRTDQIPQDKLIPRKRQPFTDDEVARLLAGIPRDHWMHGAVLLGKYFGLRLSTAVNLEWSSLPDLKRLRIFTHKGQTIVDEPLPGEVADWFREWPREGGSGLCWPGAGRPRTAGWAFTLTCRKLGIQERSFQSLRVRVVTNGINAVINQLGGDERALMTTLLVRHGVAGVQKLVGHVAGSSVTTAHYFRPPAAPA